MNEVENLKADLVKAKAELAKANEQIAVAEKTNWEKKFKDMEVAMDDLKKHLTKEKGDKESAEAAKAASISEADTAKAALKTLEASNKELQDQLNIFKTEAAKAEADRKNLARLAQVKESYSVANDEEAKKIADPLSALTDEAFASHLTVIKTFKTKEKEAKVDTKTATAALNSAVKVDEPVVNVSPANTDDEGKALAAELNSFFNLEKDKEDDEPKKKKNKNKK